MEQIIRYCMIISLYLGHIISTEAVYMDLTHNLDHTALFWPNGQESFTLNILFKGLNPIGNWYQGDELSSGTHVGTHLDAPNHFFKDGWAVADIPVDRLIAPAVIVDIRDAVSQTPDSNVTMKDINDWENQHGQIPEGSIVVMCSGWSERYPDREMVFGNDQNDTLDFHFPGFDAETATWLIEQRNIFGIAVDTPSLDYGPSLTFSTHVAAASRNVYGLENVKDTCEVPPSGATLYVSPTKIVDGSGAPVRLIAGWDNTPSHASNLMHSTLKVTFCFNIVLVIRVLFD